jgi:hypothetical protein
VRIEHDGGLEHDASATNARTRLRAVALFLAVPLMIHLYAATQARYVLDDFCWPVWIEDGFWAFQADFYQRWAGRWGNTFLGSLLGFLGPAATPWIVLSSMLAWLGATAWVAYEFTKRWLVAIIVAEAVILGTLVGAPGDALEAVYWQTGILSYLAPLAVGALALALTVRFKSPAIATTGAFVGASFHESYMLIQPLALAAGAVLFPGQRRLLAMALVGAVAGLLTVILAPGLTARMGTPANPVLPSLLITSGFTILHLLLLIASGGLLVYAVGSLTDLRWTLPRFGSIFIMLAIPVLLGAALLPVVTAGRIPPPDRSLFIAVAGAAGIAVLFGTLNRSRSIRYAIPMLGFFVVLATANSLGVAADLRAYARNWEAFDAQLRASRGQSLVTFQEFDGVFRGIRRLGSERAGGEGTLMVNECVAEFYGVGAIRSVAP